MGEAAWYELYQGLQFLGDKLEDMWDLLTTAPDSFKGGSIWAIISAINGVLGAIGTALLVLFFTIGVVKTCGSFVELKKPETAVKVFVRFAVAKWLVDSSLSIMLNFIAVIQGTIADISSATSIGSALEFEIPEDVMETFCDIGILDGAIPVWAVCFISHLAMMVIGIILLLTVYGRFFRIYMYAAISPLPLASLAGQPTESVAKSFLKSYAGVCLQGVIIVLACVIFSAFVGSMPDMDTSAEPVTMVWEYVSELIFNMLILLGLIKGSDRVVHDMLGL